MSTATETSPESPAGDPGRAHRKDPLPKAHPAVFWTGIVLMVLSFAVYPGYGIIVSSPLSPTVKLEAGIAAWITSWVSFALGSALAGAEGVEFLRRLFLRK